ncbi:MAG: hypothetical protein HC880_19345 [Bacteroidia bacterium]|nr:hypothetical protein [Bacteroidia bacterium]
MSYALKFQLKALTVQDDKLPPVSRPSVSNVPTVKNDNDSEAAVVKKIRRLLARKSATVEEIVRDFDVSRALVRSILKSIQHNAR